MASVRVTNALLLVIAAALLANLMLMWADQTATAETFQLDGCITDKPYERPQNYLHVVMHGMADVDTTQELGIR